MFKVECHAYSGEDSEGFYVTLQQAQQSMHEDLVTEIENLHNDEFDEKYDYAEEETETTTSLYVKDSDIYYDWKITEAELNDDLVEQLWRVFEDVTTREDEAGKLRICSKWIGFEKDTDVSEIQGWFNHNHSKGIDYLVNEFEM